MSGYIKCARVGAYGEIILNRPAALNALTLAMVSSMHQALDDWQNDASINAIIIKPSEPKAYCAGGDIRWLYESGKHHNPQQLQFFRDEYRLNYRMAHYSKPIIPIISGITMGGGIGISLHASHPVATNRAIFSMPETAIGFFPDIGASYLLSQCPGMTGMYLALSGVRFSAFEAKYLGLINEVIDENDVNKFSKQLHLVHTPSEIEKNVCAFSMQSPERSEIEKNINRINTYFSHERLDLIFAALEDSTDAWAQATLTLLQQKSPLSLSVTFSMMQKAQSMTLAQCLEMDYQLAQSFMNSDDFYEGVRAMVVDKDKNPRWNPPSLEDITPNLVQEFFERASNISLNPTTPAELLEISEG